MANLFILPLDVAGGPVLLIGGAIVLLIVGAIVVGLFVLAIKLIAKVINKNKSNKNNFKENINE